MLLETPNRGKIEPQLRYSISLIDNIDKFFQYAPADAKIRVLSSIFSEKLEFDGKIFRTDGLNKVFDLIYQQTNELRGLKNKSEESLSTFPASVPWAGVEPAQGWTYWCLRPARLPIPPSGRALQRCKGINNFFICNLNFHFFAKLAFFEYNDTPFYISLRLVRYL